ncbi:MAG: excinuclease ABC subunit UvrC [Propionibacteriaceae bacterium]|nr:excinuclease ABC subunit UvrC [Propionibacteriaceae bacterium]
MADPALWRPKTSEIPKQPGVYRFLDEHDRVIYVGKAKNLRARLVSYFQDAGQLHPRTKLMVQSACQVEWTSVANELEALQLEYTWIKEYEPRFNVKYRDDKSYPWLCVTWSEEYPRVFVGRGSKKKGWRYYGPYAEAWAIRESIDALLGVFPMRSCSAGVFRSAKSSGRPCLMGYIDKCCAPCVGRVTAPEHRAIAADFCSAIAGRAAGYVRTLEEQMKTYSAQMEFEKAAVARDKAEALRRVMERNAIVLEDSADLDVIAVVLDPLEVAVQLFHVRSGRILAERGWVADRGAMGEGESEITDVDLMDLIEAFILQIYGDVEGEPEERKRIIPPEILVQALPGSVGVLAELLGTERGTKVTIRVPARGDKKRLMETAEKNAGSTLLLHKTRRASDLTTRNQALAEIAEVLEMDGIPLRIEGYDISHIQGTNTVASMVVFEDGLSRKSEYRHFAITTVESNDIGAMKEVLTRRFSRLDADREAMTDADGVIDASTRTAKRFSYLPALILVDGGAGQAKIARQTLDSLGFESVMVAGLAKRLEEVWVPGQDYPSILPRTSQGLYLLQRIRDEAHRFAISYHRTKRSRSMIESLLDGVPGLGEVRRKALLKAFGSLKKLRAASVEEIALVPGFGPGLAAGVAQAVRVKDEAINLATGELID